jgi:hypothetical protein
MKRILQLFLGLLWFAFALGFGVFLGLYLQQGAGLQFFGPAISAAGLWLGLVHVVGLGTAAFICFAVSAGFCARALAPANESKSEVGRP